MQNKTQVDPGHYSDLSYDSKERFISYWHQINEITNLSPLRILEIGKGNGFILNYLTSKSFLVVAYDLDRKLNPDIVGSVIDMPFESNSFDVVACYQVLEHLSFDQFSNAIKEIYRVTSRYALVSLPDAGSYVRIDLRLPKFGRLNKLIELPLNTKKHIFDGQHYWEINKRGFPIKRIKTIFCKANFRIIKNYRVFENPYHRVFVMEKI